MSQTNNLANVEFIEYGISLIGVLSVVINALVIYIFQGLKKDVEKIKTTVDVDHDRLNKICTEHDIYHPKNGTT